MLITPLSSTWGNNHWPMANSFPSSLTTHHVLSDCCFPLSLRFFAWAKLFRSTWGGFYPYSTRILRQREFTTVQVNIVDRKSFLILIWARLKKSSLVTYVTWGELVRVIADSKTSEKCCTSRLYFMTQSAGQTATGWENNFHSVQSVFKNCDIQSYKIFFVTPPRRRCYYFLWRRWYLHTTLTPCLHEKFFLLHSIKKYIFALQQFSTLFFRWVFERISASVCFRFIFKIYSFCINITHSDRKW